MNKGTVYLSGPMTGHKNFNRAAFIECGRALESRGYNVLNPAMLPNGLTDAQYMSICQQMVIASKSMYMLKGWKLSNGALAEHALAFKLDLNVIYEA